MAHALAAPEPGAAGRRGQVEPGARFGKGRATLGKELRNVVEGVAGLCGSAGIRTRRAGASNGALIFIFVAVMAACGIVRLVASIARRGLAAIPAPGAGALA